MLTVGHSLVAGDHHMRAAAGRSRAAAAGVGLGSPDAVARAGRGNGCGSGRGLGHTGSEAGRCSLGAAGMHRVVGAGMRPGGSQLKLDRAMRRCDAAILTCP